MAGTINLVIEGDQAFTVSMMPVLTGDPLGASISFNIPVSGTVTFNSISNPFSGFVVGTSTYGEDGAETYNYSLNLTSGFGPITGSVSSFGRAELVPVPEPATMILLSIGLAGAGAAARRRRQGHKSRVMKN